MILPKDPADLQTGKRFTALLPHGGCGGDPAGEEGEWGEATLSWKPRSKNREPGTRRGSLFTDTSTALFRIDFAQDGLKARLRA